MQAKFKCENVILLQPYHGEDVVSVTLRPIQQPPEDDNHPNKSLWHFMQNGQVELHFIRADLGFKPGKEYMIELSEIE